MDKQFDQAIQEILSKTSIVDLVGADVSLRKRGTDFVGLCPFHNEKTPSFTVSESKNYYHCFGCGAHGNAIHYLMNKNNLPFKDALATLAGKCNVQLPKYSGQKVAPDQKQSVLDIHHLATEYFHTALKKSNNAAIKYIQARQVSESMINQFKIGYDDGSLSNYLLGLKFTKQMLVDAGVAVLDSGAIRDRFSQRLMFPIFDIQNRPIAFGGRTLDDARVPKYLNSQETVTFHKGYSLYNLNSATKHAKNTPIILVEGYMDAISMVSQGFPQTVASLGTALTESQIEVLWRYSERPILCLDGDSAGINASIRAAKRVLSILKPGKTLFFCYLPPNLDPDELLKTQGASVMQQYLDKAFPLVDVLWRDLVSTYEQKNLNRDKWIPEDKAALKRDILNSVKQITNQEIQEHYKQLFLERFKALSQAPPKTALVIRNVSQRPQKSVGAKILLGILLKKPIILQEVDELLSMVDVVGANLSAIKEWLLDVNASNIDLSDSSFQQQCEYYLDELGVELLKVHAPFAFDNEVPTDTVLTRWREIWFCTIGYSMIKGDFRRVSNDLRRTFDEKSWKQVKALFSNMSSFE